MDGLLVVSAVDLCLCSSVAGSALPKEVVEMVLHVFLGGRKVGQKTVVGEWERVNGVLHLEMGVGRVYWE